MQLVETVNQLRQLVSQWRSVGQTIAFVPTMGNLHQGHLSLVQLAKLSADRVVVSIFVNPLQFGPNEDFDRYPRTLDSDSQKLKQEQVDAVFVPSVEEMYPSGAAQTSVRAPFALSSLLEGASRPGHFDGVTTVVTKLFNMVQPDVAVFGQKDFQQWRIIDQMVKDLAIPIEIIRAPIERDEDGLALSSRNQYLDAGQRAIAPVLNQQLTILASQITSGANDYSVLAQNVVENLINAGFDQVDYLSVVNAKTLIAARQEDNELVILAVARLGNTRLLDNVIVTL